MGRKARGSCPLCGEKVRRKAPRCDHCGHHLEPRLERGRLGVVFTGLIVLLGLAAGLSAKGAGLFGSDPVETWQGASLVNGILPGQTSVKHLEQRFGVYDHIGTYANNLVWLRYLPAEPEVERLTVWLDGDRVVRWARVDLAGSVSPEVVQASVPGVKNIVSITPGNRFAGQADVPGELWSGGTAYLHVVDDVVRELWIIPVTVPHKDVTRALYGEPTQAFDPSGMSVDPRSGG